MKKAFGCLSLEVGGCIAGYCVLLELICLLSFLIYEPHYQQFISPYLVAIGMLCCALFIFGVHAKKRYFTIPWIFLFGLVGPFGLVLSGLYLIVFFNYVLDDPWSGWPVYLALFVFILLIYLWFVAYSLYKKMVQDNKDVKEKNLGFIASDGDIPYIDIK